MTRKTDIRRRMDGSLDTAYFVEQGRMERSRAAHKLTAAMARRSKIAVSACVGLLVLLLPHGGQG